MSVDPPPPSPSPGTPLTAVTGAIQKAAKATGASFDYLLATAKVESDLDPALTMRNSSATGLFQFIEQTWLEVMKQAGTTLGFDRYANAITETGSGRYEVADPAMRAEIMKLRTDPAANAALGGMFTQQNAAILADRIGRKPTDGELYVAHFFGPYSAAKVIRMADTDPNANAAQMFPAAARANRPIFYDKQGNSRGVAGVYQELVRRYQVARASPTPGLTGAVATVAAAPSPRRPIPKPQVLPEIVEDSDPIPAAAAASDPTRTGVTQTFAVANAQPSSAPSSAQEPLRRGDDSGPMFLSLFQTGERRGAIAPAVAELWGRGNARLRGTAVEGAPGSAFTQGPDGKAASPLDLFQDMPPTVRGLFGGNK